MSNATDLEWADQYAGKLRDELVDKVEELIAIADELRIVVNATTKDRQVLHYAREAECTRGDR
jgi:hypothetical protein